MTKSFSEVCEKLCNGKPWTFAEILRVFYASHNPCVPIGKKVNGKFPVKKCVVLPASLQYESNTIIYVRGNTCYMQHGNIKFTFTSDNEGFFQVQVDDAVPYHVVATIGHLKKAV